MSARSVRLRPTRLVLRRALAPSARRPNSAQQRARLLLRNSAFRNLEGTPVEVRSPAFSPVFWLADNHRDESVFHPILLRCQRLLRTEWLGVHRSRRPRLPIQVARIWNPTTVGDVVDRFSLRLLCSCLANEQAILVKPNSRPHHHAMRHRPSHFQVQRKVRRRKVHAERTLNAILTDRFLHRLEPAAKPKMLTKLTLENVVACYAFLDWLHRCWHTNPRHCGQPTYSEWIPQAIA